MVVAVKEDLMKQPVAAPTHPASLERSRSTSAMLLRDRRISFDALDERPERLDGLAILAALRRPRLRAERGEPLWGVAARQEGVEEDAPLGEVQKALDDRLDAVRDLLRSVRCVLSAICTGIRTVTIAIAIAIGDSVDPSS